ncbi:MAG: lipopolysaccharide kinase InaA family protein [Thermoplasmatota archaeon]
MAEKNDSDLEDTKILEELAKKIEESQFEGTWFRKDTDDSHPHFSSVIKEIKDGKKNSHLVKIRPPLFFLSGFLSNISRKLSGMENLKILDNKRWQEREIAHLRNINPDLILTETQYENALLMEKIEGDVTFDILTSDEESNEKKLEVIKKVVEGLKNIHDKNLFHGEPTTQNCILGADGDIYWIDFEIEYHEDLTETEIKARDLEQLTLSVLGAFEEEEDIGLTDGEIIDLIFDTYADNHVISTFKNNPHIPLIGPYRVYQLSFVSLLRFYQVQINLMDYIREH